MRILKDSLASRVGTDASIWAGICLSCLGPPASGFSLPCPAPAVPTSATLGLAAAALRLAFARAWARSLARA